MQSPLPHPAWCQVSSPCGGRQGQTPRGQAAPLKGTWGGRKGPRPRLNPFSSPGLDPGAQTSSQEFLVPNDVSRAGREVLRGWVGSGGLGLA